MSDLTRLVEQLRETMRRDGCPVCGAMTPPCAHSLALRDLLAEPRKVETLQKALDKARVAGAAYYEAHVEDDESACPCEACVRARAVFARTMAEASS